jgi:hypothetical protein
MTQVLSVEGSDEAALEKAMDEIKVTYMPCARAIQ